MLAFAEVNTKLGEGTIVSSVRGLCYFSLYRHAQDTRCWLATHFPEEDDLVMVPDFPHLVEAVKQLNEYLAGRRSEFSLPMDLKGTRFQTAVWRSLLKVSYGDTTTYGALALAAGYPQSARAVGNAMRANPLPVFIPCHRVLPTDRSVGHYAGGKELKRQLLELEGVLIK